VRELKTPEAFKALASRLAPFVSPVDFIALNGELGAGKTTFAQGLLPALGVRDPVTSPTYELVHTHHVGMRTIHHCDFYRLGPPDAEEIGFAEMCASAIVIAEWPDAIGSGLPSDRLEVNIEGTGGHRRVRLKGLGKWQQQLHRFEEISEFLDRNGWGDACCTAVIGDASARLFSRFQQDSRSLMLMDWLRQSDGPPIRDGRPYCDIAHLAREGTPFIAVSQWLRERAGLSAPNIAAYELDPGLFLVEDLGDGVLGRLAGESTPLEPLYAIAVDGLLALRASKPPRDLPLEDNAVYRVPAFDREALEVELELILEWYLKRERAVQTPPNLSRSFFEAWKPFLNWLESQAKTLVLRDFHSPNLLLCEERAGVARLGVIDFQDALWGHPAYDLVSLLQDARLDVPEAVERTLYDRYCAGAAKDESGFDFEAFAKAYAILGAQRNTKILGIFARLSIRDGKHAYLAHLPRIQRYLRRNLAHPDLRPLKAWYEANLLT
jgi:N-acetylmuramate 1-kinase